MIQTHVYMDFLHQFVSETLIYALGWTVLHSLWQGLLIALVMVLLFQALENKSAKLRYEVASFALFLVFISSLCTFFVLYDAIDQQSIQGQLQGDWMMILQGESSTGFLQHTIQQSMDYFNQYLPMIVSAWFMGAFFFSLRLIGGLAYVQHLKYNDNDLLPAFWQKQMNELAYQLRLEKKVDLLESALVKVPLVIGFFKPAILMPLGAINSLSEKEVEAILAHELAHIYRNDFLLNILFSFIEILFYYHPAVWWISANVRLERENCCDDIAVRLCGNSLTYAKALVKLQEMNRNQIVPSFAMPFSGRKNQLLNRVQRILNQSQNRSNIMEKMTATGLLVFILAFLSISAKTPIDPPQNQTVDLIRQNINLPTNAEVFLLPNDDEIIAQITQEGFHATSDTLPQKKNKQRIIKTEDDQTIDLTLENGKIQQLIIDGETIPESELPEYEALVAETMEEFSNITPAPPAPPRPPAPIMNNGRFAPPTPPAPAMDNRRFAPPAPPAPPKPPRFSDSNTTTFNSWNSNKTVTTRSGDDGETIIVIEGQGKEPMEIVVQSNNEAVIIDGQSIQSGDTIIIPNYRFPLIEDELKGLFPADIVTTKDGSFFSSSFSIEDWAPIDLKELMEQLTATQKELAQSFPQLLESTKDLKKLERAHLKEFLQSQKSDFKEFQEQIRELKHEQKEKLEEQSFLRQDLEEMSEQKQNLFEELEEAKRHIHAELFSDKHQGYFNSKVNRLFEDALVNDGLITDRGNYSFKLTNKSLKINGKKQSKDLHKKYKQFYKSVTGAELTKKSTLEVKRRN